MAFTPSNYNNNGGYNNQPTENKPKSNFTIGSVRGSDGIIDVKAWRSTNNTLYAAISIRQMIGKDPQGRTNYETGLSKDRPGVLIRPDHARSLYEFLNNQDPSRINLVDFAPSPEYKDQTISVVGSESNVKFTIKDPKGTRVLTIDATPIGGTYSHGAWKNFLSLFWKEIENAIFSRVSEELNNNTNTEETPF
jgi:hypothetical protein